MPHRHCEPDPASGIVPPPPSDVGPVLARARALQQAALAGAPLQPLKGKYVGLISEDPDSPDAALFVAAAGGLGAQVAQIRPSVARLGTGSDVEPAAMWLGRLYDVVACEGLAPGTVRRIRAAAGVPVLDGLAGESHSMADRVHELDGCGGVGADDDEGRRFLLQALLLDLIA